MTVTPLYGKLLGERLRAVRQQLGLSLGDIQEQSRGRWNAQTVGAYERGDRTLTVERLAGLAAFYGVPVAGLIVPAGPPAVEVPG